MILWDSMAVGNAYVAPRSPSIRICFPLFKPSEFKEGLALEFLKLLAFDDILPNFEFTTKSPWPIGFWGTNPGYWFALYIGVFCWWLGVIPLSLVELRSLGNLEGSFGAGLAFTPLNTEFWGGV